MGTAYVLSGYNEPGYVQDSVSIDWKNKIIYIPKVYMTLVQSFPSDVYELDTNKFRLKLKDLEDGDEGMSFLDTHRHNTEVSVGGVTLARVIEIINGYTITFEDGQYSVNLVGSNNNIADKVNLNQVSVRAANSAGLIGAQVIQDSVIYTKHLVEGLRNHHTATGKIFFWDYALGDNNNVGTSPDSPCKTFQHIHDNLCVSGRHDAIICLDDPNPGSLVISGNIVISKDFIFLRGPGRGINLSQSNINLPAVTITGTGCQIEKFKITSNSSSTAPTISITGTFTHIKDVWIDNSADGILVSNSNFTHIQNTKIRHNTGYGIKITGHCEHTDIEDTKITSSGTHGIWVDISSPGHEVNIVGSCVIHKNGGYGLNISSGAEETLVGDTVQFFDNTLGDVNDLGTNTYLGNSLTRYTDAIWNSVASSYNTAGTMGQKLNGAGTAGDPWTADLSGYGAGTAGKALKDTGLLPSATVIADQVRTELTPELTHIMAQQNGLTNEQAIMLTEIFRMHGLDPTKPLVVTKTSRTAGIDISQTISGDSNSTTVTRI